MERRGAKASLLLGRFGFGGRPGDGLMSEGEARAALAAEISPRAVARPQGIELMTSAAALSELDEFRTETQKRQAGIQAPARPAPAAPPVLPPPQMMAGPAVPTPALPPFPQRVYRSEATARMTAAIASHAGFAERLVWFWSNHFCVSIAKSQPLRTIAGAYEREAIRPHVFGRFSDMLAAVVRHPAMLMYLDNRQSIGPGSRAGTRRGRGLNENLAREILELHTLGVGGGYSQADVTGFARTLTGWTVIGPADEEGEIGEFRFNINRHEPGPQTVLGKVYADGGEAQARKVLDDIARHPATAKFIATKLARHFFADEPPAGLIARIEEVFRRSEGDLAAVSRALLAAPEALAPATKIRSPQEFIAAAARALGEQPEIGRMLGTLNAFGHVVWMPSGPNGYPDTAAHWISPEGMKLRLEAAWQLGRLAATPAGPVDVLEATLGELASDETRTAVARASSRAQGLALLLLAPEFQHR